MYLTLFIIYVFKFVSKVFYITFVYNLYVQFF
jgi:hypothetical protein